MHPSFSPQALHGCQDLAFVRDPGSGLRAIVATHHLHNGVAFGGVRRRCFGSEQEAVHEVLGLARSMGRKCALAGVPGGGAKAVLLDEAGLDLAAVYRSFGAWIESQGGRFRTGPDVGTGDEQLAHLAETTSFVAAPPPAGPEDLAGATVAGVLGGLGAAFEEHGVARFEGRRVILVGLGKVGGRLARELNRRGSLVYGWDLDPEATARAVEESGLTPVPPGSEYTLRADALAPCALGGFLGPRQADRIVADVLCGAANDPLERGAEEHTTARLAARGITYLPDFAVSAGAVLRGAQVALGHRISSLEEIEGEIRATCADILGRSGASARTPHAVASELADAKLALRRVGCTPMDFEPGSPVRTQSTFQLERP